ncbi:MAG TPA: hypothetical protein VIV60_14795 [Polyangiaceae bacterium]
MMHILVGEAIDENTIPPVKKFSPKARGCMLRPECLELNAFELTMLGQTTRRVAYWRLHRFTLHLQVFHEYNPGATDGHQNKLVRPRQSTLAISKGSNGGAPGTLDKSTSSHFSA